MLPGIAFLAPAPNPSAEFQKCVAYYRTNSYAVDVDTVAAAAGKSLHTNATIIRRSPTWASIEIRSEPTQYIGPYDWLYELKSNQLIVFDVRRGAYERQKAVKTGEAVALLADPAGKAVPEAAADLMSPDLLAAFFARFSAVADWKHSNSNGVSRWTHRGAAGSVDFALDAANGRILSCNIDAKQSSLLWNFHYHRLDSLKPFTLPASAVHLLGLRLPAPPPHYDDRDVQRAVERALYAYGRTLHLQVTIREAGKRVQLWRNGDAVAQTGDAGGWSWGAGKLTAWVPKKGVYRGSCRMDAITEYLAYFNLPAEPMVHDFIVDDNFAAKLFTPEFTVKSVGSVTVKGVHLTLLDLTGTQIRISLGMNDEGLITQLDSTTFDGSGRAISQSSRQFSYEPVKAWPKPPTGPTKPLPKIRIT